MHKRERNPSRKSEEKVEMRGDEGRAEKERERGEWSGLLMMENFPSRERGGGEERKGNRGGRRRRRKRDR